MADVALQVKIDELDKKVEGIYGRIGLIGKADHAQIKEELAKLKSECMENETAMREKLKGSKSAVAQRICAAFEEVEAAVHKAEEDLEGACGTAVPDGGAQAGRARALCADEMIMFAEYSLDFAMQSASRALLRAFEAIDAQMTEEEREEEA